MVSQLQHETVEQIISVALMNLSALISTYIPSNFIFEKKRVMFETLFKILQRSDIEPSLRIPLVDNLFAFVSDKKDIELAL